MLTSFSLNCLFMLSYFLQNVPAPQQPLKYIQGCVCVCVCVWWGLYIYIYNYV